MAVISFVIDTAATSCAFSFFVNGTSRFSPGGYPQRLRRILTASALLFVFTACGSAFAGSATWDLSPGSGDWNTNTNWTPATGYPNSSTDVATFAVSNTTGVSISANTTVAGITFSSGASAFTISANAGIFVTISGAGMTNSSANTQNFVLANGGGNFSEMDFNGTNATAGSNVQYTLVGSATLGSGNSVIFFNGTSSTAGSATFIDQGATAGSGFGGAVNFEGTSSTAGTATITNNAGTSGGGGGYAEFDAGSAGSAHITNNGGAVSGAYGLAIFDGTATASSATIVNNGGTASGADGGQTQIFSSSTAGSSTITSNAGTVAGSIGGSTHFSDTADAGSATLIANGGTGGGGYIQFIGTSTGGTSRIEVFNNGTGTPGYLDISQHNAPGVTIGSLEGSGNVFLGTRNLTIGSNNLSTTFSGVIHDGAPAGGGGTGGSLTKIGSGTLSLTNANTYTGGTLINAGTLVAAHDGALGSGNVSLTASGVTLTLQTGVTNNYIADNATISIVSGATVNLNFTGLSDIVGSIILNGLTETAPGTYGAPGSGATFQSVFFSGTGTLDIVPEPATWTLVGVGAGVLALVGFRRQRN
jgi:autotransporter-associated beta strand protein